MSKPSVYIFEDLGGSNYHEARIVGSPGKVLGFGTDSKIAALTASGGTGGIASVVEDTSPQLGGNLDTNGHNIDSITPAELGWLSGVTSEIQTQLDAKQDSDSAVRSFNDLTGSAALAQIDRSATVIAEAATVTIPANSHIKTVFSGTLATLAFAAGSPTEGQIEIANIDFTVTGTLNIPACRALGDRVSRTTLKVSTAGIHELVFIRTNGEWILASSIVSFDKRTGTTTSSATPSINTDAVDLYSITALAVNITSMTTNLSGTITEGQQLVIWIKDNGSAKTISWGASFAASTDLPLPTTTTGGKYLYCTFIGNSVLNKWVLIGKLDNI